MDTHMIALFHQYIIHVKNLDHYDEKMLSNMERFSPDHKMSLIRVMNDVIISLKDILFLEPIKEVP